MHQTRTSEHAPAALLLHQTCTSEQAMQRNPMLTDFTTVGSTMLSIMRWSCARAPAAVLHIPSTVPWRSSIILYQFIQNLRCRLHYIIHTHKIEVEPWHTACTPSMQGCACSRIFEGCCMEELSQSRHSHSKHCRQALLRNKVQPQAAWLSMCRPPRQACLHLDPKVLNACFKYLHFSMCLLTYVRFFLIFYWNTEQGHSPFTTSILIPRTHPLNILSLP